MPQRFNAVLFDLLSALLDSWSLWDDVAGDPTLGRDWRLRYLEVASRTKRYEPYLSLVRESAAAVGLPKSLASALESRWCELTPWPEAVEVIPEVASSASIGVITNCSETMGVDAANKLVANFDVVLTAERAGYYKPDPRVYEVAISEIGEAPEHILYVAGSPYDVCGAAASGMPVFWHNRVCIHDAKAASSALSSADTLLGLRSLIR